MFNASLAVKQSGFCACVLTVADREFTFLV